MKVGDKVIVDNVKEIIEISDGYCVLSDGVSYPIKSLIPVENIVETIDGDIEEELNPEY